MRDGTQRARIVQGLGGRALGHDAILAKVAPLLLRK
jgi:hypothetical protein